MEERRKSIRKPSRAAVSLGIKIRTATQVRFLGDLLLFVFKVNVFQFNNRFFFVYMREIIFDNGISQVGESCFGKHFEKVELLPWYICEEHEKLVGFYFLFF